MPVTVFPLAARPPETTTRPDASMSDVRFCVRPASPLLGVTQYTCILPLYFATSWALVVSTSKTFLRNQLLFVYPPATFMVL